MSRLAGIIERVESGGAVDLEKEAALLALDVAKCGEDFVAEAIELSGLTSGGRRYDGVKHIEFHDNGAIKSIDFHDRTEDTTKEVPRE